MEDSATFAFKSLRFGLGLRDVSDKFHMALLALHGKQENKLNGTEKT